MKKNKKFFYIFLVSILLHLIAYLIWSYVKPHQDEIAPSAKTITVKLSSPPPKDNVDKKELESLEEAFENSEPEPEPSVDVETMMPVDNADIFSSNNQSDKSEDKIVFGEENAEKVGEKLLKEQAISDERHQETAIENTEEVSSMEEQAETEKTTTKFEQKIDAELVSSLANSNFNTPQKQLIEHDDDADFEGLSKEKASSIKPDYYDYFSGIMEQQGEELSQSELVVDDVIYEPGNIALLGDKEMSEVVVEQPFSELKSEELKLANAFLDRMNKQVLAVWNNPYKGQHIYRGTVKLELDENGYLQDVYIYRASGHPALDASVINAIRAVARFEVPENKILATRYYTNLRFYYSSTENKTELMPFQKETEKEK